MANVIEELKAATEMLDASAVQVADLKTSVAALTAKNAEHEAALAVEKQNVLTAMATANEANGKLSIAEALLTETNGKLEATGERLTQAEARLADPAFQIAGASGGKAVAEGGAAAAAPEVIDTKQKALAAYVSMPNRTRADARKLEEFRVKHKDLLGL